MVLLFCRLRSKLGAYKQEHVVHFARATIEVAAGKNVVLEVAFSFCIFVLQFQVVKHGFFR